MRSAAKWTSRPSRGAWIETRRPASSRTSSPCRALHGARGLKPSSVAARSSLPCRALHGARGLKPHPHRQRRARPRSRPSRGAWIETVGRPRCGTGLLGRALHGARGLKHRTPMRLRALGSSRPSRGAWIETARVLPIALGARGSRPSRGAWIETVSVRSSMMPHTVAPFTGRVD